MSAYLSEFFIIFTSCRQVVRSYLVSALLFFFFVQYNFSWDVFDIQTDFTKNLTILQSVIHAEDIPKFNQTEWYIRLSVAMPSKGLKDSSSTLGVNPKSSIGQDLLDIPIQPRPPWIEDYLELVFPHPEWDGELTDLSSDFRGNNPDNPGKTKVKRWHFEVRSNILNEEVNFAWHGPAYILTRCQLRDDTTGGLLVTGPMKDGYTFKMTAPVHKFVWEYNY